MKTILITFDGSEEIRIRTTMPAQLDLARGDVVFGKVVEPDGRVKRPKIWHRVRIDSVLRQGWKGRGIPGLFRVSPSSNPTTHGGI